MKIPISITIDENLLKFIDKQVDGITIKNRSHCIECMVDNYRERIV